MKALFFTGLVVLCLGLLSFRRSNTSYGSGRPYGRLCIDLALMQRSGEGSTTVTMAMILGGLGAMVAAKGKLS